MDETTIQGVVGQLSPFPCSVNALFWQVGTIRLTLTGPDDHGVRCDGPAVVLKEGAKCQIRSRTFGADGQDIDFEVAEAYFESATTNSALLVPTRVVHRPAKREAKRARVETPVHGHSYSTGAQFEARLADASVTGVGLNTPHRLVVGEQVSLSVELPDGTIEVDAMVVGERRGPFGRTRFGCELTRIDPHHQDMIARLADTEVEPDIVPPRTPATLPPDQLAA
jgi:hypothetical protein